MSQSPVTSPLAGHLQSTLVRPDTTRTEMIRHLEECAVYHFHAAMIPMCYVPLARTLLRGTPVRVATTICFGTGHETVAGKVALLRECVDIGADEVDYQPNMTYFLSGMHDEFHAEARALVAAAGGMTLKAMLELHYIAALADKQTAIRLLEEAGVPWIKNSSGGGPRPGHATPEDIRLLRATVKATTHVKASGGIKDYAQAQALRAAGAELLGTSAAVAIVTQQAATATTTGDDY
ncbi:MAG: deoxyribose-phosphate aldolase [Anaerolineae bacterium]|jgi:deoxyribose-phosphate aldolase|nr:deoxyribose-phosphate aldolase [Anaerolineae bacterium]